MELEGDGRYTFYDFKSVATIIYALRSHISSNGNKNIGSSGTTQLISGYGKRLKVDQLTSPVFVMSRIVEHL